MAVCHKILSGLNSGRRFIFGVHKNGKCWQAQTRSFHVTAVNRLILSPHEITDVLRENEFGADLSNGPVKSYETNQVAANSPCEDYTAEAQCQLTSGHLFGVFDGHGGGQCANVTSKRLFQYLAASLLPEEALNTFISTKEHTPLIEHFNPNKAKMDFVPDLKKIYDDSFDRFLHELEKFTEDNIYNLESLIEFTFETYDKGLSTEFLENYDMTKKVDQRLLDAAFSGAVACVAYIDGHHLHICNTGDCSAVMGSISEDNDWITKKLCVQHVAENKFELNRIVAEHFGERDTVVRGDRLLGYLLPFRAFGDYRYKWDRATLENVIVPVMKNIIPENYFTPPYLTAKPEIFRYKLTPRDKFLVLATDGLWDVFTPHEVVTLVGEHMLGKAAFTPVQFSKGSIYLSEVMEILEHRQESLQNKPIDRNAATHLIRHAIGSTDSGIISNNKLSRLLSMPPKKARRYRDDISITVIYFDTEYLRSLPE